MTPYVAIYVSLSYIWGGAITVTGGPTVGAWQNQDYVELAPCIATLSSEDGLELASEARVNRSIVEGGRK